MVINTRTRSKGEEPALPLHAIKRAVPPHGLADARHVLHDERVDAPGDGGLPRLHAGDVSLHARRPHRTWAAWRVCGPFGASLSLRSGSWMPSPSPRPASARTPSWTWTPSRRA